MVLFTQQNSAGIARCKLSGACCIVLMVLLCGGGGYRTASAADTQGVEALSALDAFAASNTLAPNEEILGLVGFDGLPLPEIWLVLTRRSESGGSLHEYAWSGDAVTAQRTVPVLPGQNLPDLPLDRKSLLISSAQAFGLARDRALALRVHFSTVRYQLRVREEGCEPIWSIEFLDRARGSLGILYLSASSGEIRRETWHQSEIK